MKGKIVFFTVSGVAIVLLLSTVFLWKENRVLRRNLPFLFPGEDVKQFELVDMSGKKTGIGELKGDLPALIFVFEQPCSPCNKNINLWRKLAELSAGKVKVFGIIIDSYDNVKGFSSQFHLNFPLYAPEDREAFLGHFRVFQRYAQTLLVHRGKVRASRLGDLDMNDFKTIAAGLAKCSAKVKEARP